MSETLTQVRPQGLFDRATRGASLPTAEVTVERGRVQFFAEVLGLRNPAHTDLTAAQAAGYPDLVAPPSFFTVIDAMANDALRRGGHLSAAELIRCDFTYLLHGDETYDFHGPIFAGDTIAVRSRIADFYDKKGGAMEFAVIECELVHAKRGPLLKATRTLLHKLI